MADYLPVQEEERLRAKYRGVFAALDRAIPKTIVQAAVPLSEYANQYSERFDMEDGLPILCNWMWQKHRVVYSIDSTLLHALYNSGLKTDTGEPIPVDLLMKTPFPCFVVHTPPFTIQHGMDGKPLRQPIYYKGSFYVYVTECGMLTRGPELCAVAEIDRQLTKTYRTSRFVQSYLPLVSDFESAFAAMRDGMKKNGDYVSDGQEIREHFLAVVAAQIILYLQSLDADIQHRPSTAKKKKKGIGAPTSKPPKVWDVGVHIGATLRDSAVRTVYDGDLENPPDDVQHRGPVRPHSRRGHWHRFWTGPRDGERKLVIKWVAPTFIHANLAVKNKSTTVHPVRK